MKRAIALLATAAYTQAACVPDAPWAPGTCAPNPCEGVATADACHDVEVAVLPCPDPLPDPDYCFMTPCMWDGFCKVTECQLNTEAKCNAEAHCSWDTEGRTVPAGPVRTVVEFCHHNPCKGITDVWSCQSTDGCTYDYWGGGCVLTGCAKHTSESSCDQDAKCEWNNNLWTPCVKTPCANKAKATCDKDNQCMFKGTDCVRKTCDKYNNPDPDMCACARDPDCKWHYDATHPHCADPKFAECPDLDIAIMLDGSGSMRNPFGSHPHGFYGMMELLRGWARSIPLTGENHLVGAATTAKGTGEFRVTFMQFAQPNADPSIDHPVNCAAGACTSGLLSGQLAELEGDITWHENNYQAHWTYIHDALQDVADHTFLPSQSPPWRQHVVMIINDGGLTDFDGNACCHPTLGCADQGCKDWWDFDPSFPGMLDKAQDDLRKENVVVYGVVIRRFQAHDKRDEEAEKKLKTMVSDPRDDHYVNILLDGLVSEVLDTLCDPTSKFGKSLAAAAPGGGGPTGCGPRATSTECAKNPSCYWDDQQMPPCKDDVCFPLCTQTECEANALCAWDPRNGGSCGHKPPTCTDKTTEAECKMDDTCLWNPVWHNGCTDNVCRDHTGQGACEGQDVTMPAPCVAPNGQPDYCQLEVCAYDPMAKTCDVKKCLNMDEAKCTAESGCFWEPSINPLPTGPPSTLDKFCGPEICKETTDCEKDWRCKLDAAMMCKKKVCYPFDQMTCTDDPRCDWDTATNPARCVDKECMKHDNSGTCNADSMCMWIDTPMGCIPATAAPPTAVPDTDAPPTNAPPTNAPPTNAPPTNAPPTDAPPTNAPPTNAPPTNAPPTNAPPTAIPDTDAPPTDAPPTPVPTVPDTDECADSAKAMVCEAVGQVCVDEELKVDDSFMCRCPPPFTQTASGMAATCSYDECKDNSGTCTMAGQVCEDTKGATLDDWECKCVAPQTGMNGQQQAGDCKDPPGDCKVHGDVCHAAGQACVDTVPLDDTIECECMPPSSGTSVQGAAATCVLDECTVVCPSCAKTSAAGKNVCTDAGQTCVDPSHDPNVLSDWKCECVAPYTGHKIAAAATCEINECTAICPHCADSGSGNVCEAEGQACLDSDLTKDNDWECHCVSPKAGTAVGGVATCEENECETHETVCVKAGQACVDPTTGTSGDWTCVCPLPSKSVGQQQATVCETDECEKPEVKEVCTAVGQDCHDPDLVNSNTWECQCRAPATGVKVQHPVDKCVLDECAVQCPTCANKDGTGNVCELNGQTCEDPHPTTASKSDWTCTCPNKVQQAITSAVPECKVGKDECVDGPSTAVTECVHMPRYTEAGCLCKCGWLAQFTCNGGTNCVDISGPGKDAPCEAGCCNPDQQADGDWCYVDKTDAYNQNKPQCLTEAWGTCTGRGQVPVDGGKTLRPTIPGVPPGQNNKCTDVGQKCVDPNDLADNDWVCECVLPQTGTPGAQQPATCETDECTEHGATCVAQGQVCTDTDKMTDDTWQCSCPIGPANPMPLGTTVCELDECVEVCPTCAMESGVNVCEGAGQTCEDPNNSTKSLSDWVCSCPPPATGTAVGAPADCVLDECTTVCTSCADNGGGQNVCLAAGQTCDDPVKTPGSTSDWTCTCPAPFTDVQKASAAVCEKDECEEHGAKCGAGQICADTNPKKLDDWMCECLPPATGVATAGAADCKTDECKDNAATCTAKGQHCVDPDLARDGDWICECIAPDVGAPGQQQASTDCQPIDACKDSATICSDAGQHCVPGMPGMFLCDCIAPATGTPKAGAPTVCETDECTVVCPTCQQTTDSSPAICDMAGQVCVDPDKTVASNWECQCPPPTTGTAGAMKPATCELDECAVAMCASCAGTTCSDAGQTCKEGSTSPKHLADWHCVCPPPSNNTARAAAAVACTYDECSDPTVLATCTGASPEQICVDPDTKTQDNWECHCKPPASGKAAGAPATGCDIINECAVECPHCANTGGGNVCQGQNQKCVDPNHKTTSDWYCECVVGTGMSVGSPVAKCVLDECKQECPTCADKGGGNVCEKEGQTCVDPTDAVDAVSDWSCVCPPPLQFITAPAQLAVCGLDECKDDVNGAGVPGKVCTDGGQLCTDAHPGSLNDFVCQCPPPSTGSHTAALAECATDECKVTGNEICGNATQVCLDPDTTNLHDWICECPPPSVSVAVGQVAVCEIDECLENGHVCDTATPQQDCVDPDKTNGGDWECRCRTPSTGTATGAAAVCSLDECKEDCATCSHGKCKKAGQTCTDPNPTYSGLNDWVCTCAPPSVGTAVANAAVCPRDECAENEATCLDKGQKCVDPDHDEKSLGDWECLCHAPATGRGVAAAADCVIDECKEHGHVCTDAGQTCFDADKAAAAIGGWVCQCVPPAVGDDVSGKPASCRLVGECEDPLVGEVCTSQGQTCVDPNKLVDDDWKCVCVAPSVGTPVVGGPATCKLDECTTACATCAGTTCSDANQDCLDTNQDPVSGLNSWECVCQVPYQGSKVAGRATCTVDECDLHGSTCTGAEQDCFDPSNAALGDWMCKCRAPAVGQATGKDAHCETDECKTHAKTCTDKGQTCFDPDHGSKSLNDWECVCEAPSVGKKTAGAVDVCELDECLLYGDVCTSVGQTCKDEEKTEHGWWKCFCPPPNQKRSGDGKAAVCEINECTTVGNTTALPTKDGQNVCAQNQQTCEDPNVSADSLRDWVCTCPPPSNSSAVAAVAVCEYDECKSKADICGPGQGCFDTDFTQDGFECRCTPPAIGTGSGAAADCQYDECSDHGDACRNVQQVCVDTDKKANGTWSCHCPANGPVVNSTLGGPTHCDPPAESECNIPAIAAVCTDAGQLCVDPEPFATKNNWLCECVPPATGANMAGAPTACVIDECTADCDTCQQLRCAAAGQTCNDPDTSATSLSDWTCTCTAPRTGVATAAVAECQLDECTVVCDSCADHNEGNACLKHDQLCVDPNKDARSTSDWLCVCKAPAAGNATVGVARCVIDECETKGALVCGDGQTCTDPNKVSTSLNDWTCTCDLPASGSAVAMRAHCSLNECGELDPATHFENYKTCEAAGQTCIDPNPAVDKLGDWECHCPEGHVKKTAAAAVCVLDECKDTCPTCADTGGGNLCATKGQTCEDPDTSPSKTNDWTCTCPEGSPSAIGNVAKCLLDECTELGNFAAHTCMDKNVTTEGGCECACGWKADGSFVTNGFGPGFSSPCMAGCCNPDRSPEGAWCMPADTPTNRANGCLKSLKVTCGKTTFRGGVAPPAVDNVCTKAGQKCVDENKAASSQADWKCECIKPKTGDHVLGGVAVCEENECEVHGAVCAAAGQECVDPSGTTTGDWECRCVAPSTGSQAGGVATCEYTGECDDNAAVCAAVGQTCFDPSTTVLGDWMCKCVAPATGVSVKGAPAVCKLDECVVKCPTCADKGHGNVCKKEGQMCVEGSLSPADVEDWKCVCPEGQTGKQTAAVAVCRQDECTMDGGRLGSVCGTAGQSCVDPNTLVKEGAGDWTCVCAPPAVGQATGKAAKCSYDECADPAKAGVCTAAGQECVDKNLAAYDDWVCQCMEVDPTLEVKKTKKGAPADCSVPPSSWCVQNGQRCTEQGQVCITVMGDPAAEGSCGCIPPLVGTPRKGGPAVCELDECTVTCATCADTGTGNVCEKAGQLCEEGSKDPKSGAHDWRCVCKNSPISTVAGLAQCTVNECETVGTKKCTEGAQLCVDPDTDDESLNDWYCKCYDPAVGKKLMDVAVCVFDECLVNEATCSAAAQTCQDPNKSADSMGDWICTCPAPSTGSAVASAATCKMVGDCEKAEISAVCTSAGQQCVDPDVNTVGDWTCVCVAPKIGVAGNQTAAACTLDECKAVCATCAQKPGSQTHACTAAEQTCVDTNTADGSTSDWKCLCVAPKKGEQMVAPATCKVDECLNEGNQKICAAVKNAAGDTVQTCNDPDDATVGDWVCVCDWPYTGTQGLRSSAKCKLDECEAPKDWLGKDNGNKVCGDAGQTCLDPQQEVGGLGNWVCQCLENDKVKLGGPVASVDCQPPTVSKCATHGSTCPSGQQCVEKQDSWFCLCVAPTTGEAKEAAATCELDECIVRCETCAQRGSVHVCAVAGQACHDDDKSVDHTGDWICECEIGKGHAQGKAATCLVDECEVNKGVCTAAEQVCSDPSQDASHKGDWICTCAAPSSGFAVAGPADCEYDECRDHGAKCASAGQTCVDQNTAPSSQGDWVCKCPPPAKGQMTGAVATCKYTGGCDIEDNLNLCVAAGQKCVPGANATSWFCACQAPARGEMGSASLALCKINECEEICPTCARTTVGGANVCTAAKQECYDPNTSDRSLGDWMCECPPPSTAAALGKAVEKCVEDECTTVSQHGAVKCEHFQRFTVDGCQCACPWRVVVQGAPPGTFSGPGYSEDCVSGCCNPDKDVNGDWCMIADTPYNTAKGCAPQTKATCADRHAKPPTGAPAVTGRPADLDKDAVLNVCNAVGQICVDKNTLPTSQGDWVCECPDSDKSAHLKPATCDVNECLDISVCAQAGQKCVDPDTAAESLNNWECHCIEHDGTKVGGVAECMYPGDDECEANQKTCHDAGQSCYDHDTTRMGDWECRCTLPSIGAPVTAGVATCVLDECSAQCPTCADKGKGHHVCLEKGQLCTDPDTTPGSVSDWSCICPAPSTGTKVAGVAKCEYDECTVPEIKAVCTAAGQNCLDRTTSVDKTNDWVCTCPAADAVGEGSMKPAVCIVDECLVDANSRTCAAAGQTCFDPFPTDAQRNDWTCQCPLPSTGKQTQGPATCVFKGECDVLANSNVCTDAGQTCVDPDVVVENDWMCICVAPQTGHAGLMEKGLCGVDECKATCPTCEAGVCTKEGQVCHDPDVSVEGNWVCKCAPPMVGPEGAQAPAAECRGKSCVDYTHDECDAEANCEWDEMLKCIDKRTPPPPVWTIKCVLFDSEDKCAKDPFCKWSGNSCTNECSAVTNSTTCAEAEACRWDAIQGCIPDRTPEPAGWTLKCSLYTDTDQCKADPHCKYTEAKNCTAVCADFTEQKPCNATAECKWDESEKCVSTREPPVPRFVHKCVLQGDEASCTNDPHCMWEGQRCKPSCWASMDEATCVQNELCMWGGGGEWGPDKCQTKRTPAPGYTLDCKKNTAEDACKQDPMCAWNTEKAACESTKCDQTTEATCNADRYCQWNAFESTCYLKCESLQGFPECNKAAHCMYDENERCVAKGTPAPPGMECSMTKQSECNADPQCDWSEEKGKCFVMTCTGYTGEPRCTEDARCLWQGDLSKCYWRCEAVVQEPTCVDDARCTWSANETRCHVKQCPSFLSENRCTANATDHCTWEADKTCRSECAAETLKTSCDLREFCMWDEEEKCIAKKDEPPYSLCPLLPDKETCDITTGCVWDPEEKCLYAQRFQPAPPMDGDDDDDCWWCWLLLALLLLCCSCCIAAFFFLKKRQQHKDQDDDKWNKHFHAQLDEDELDEMNDKDDDKEQSLIQSEMSPHSKTTVPEDDI